MIVGRWKEEDLVKLADGNALDPAELPPLDAAHYGSGLSVLGHGAATLGAEAFNLTTGAVRNCEMLRLLSTQSPPATRTKQQTDILRDVERRTKYALGEALLLLEDALQLAPGWIRHERFDLGDSKSDLGQKLVAELRAVPLPRFRRLRRFVADLLRALARRIDTARRE